MRIRILEKFPTRKESISFLKRVGCNQRVIEHSKTVSKYAVEIADKCRNKRNINRQLVEIGALLHDVGRALTNDVRHAVLGAALIRAADFHEDLVNLVERHIGAGIPKEEARKLGLPSKSYMPKKIEEKIVSYADKLIRGKKRITPAEAINDISHKLGPRHPAIKRFENLDKEIRSLMDV